jgi:AcrR family transcriptional regulator
MTRIAVILATNLARALARPSPNRFDSSVFAEKQLPNIPYAVYARFATKDELFFTLYVRWEEKILARLDNLPNVKTLEEFALESARRVIASRREDADFYLLLLEFWTYAARDERLRHEFAARHNQQLQRIADRLETIAARLGMKLRMSALELARAGSTMQQSLPPGTRAHPEFLGYDRGHDDGYVLRLWAGDASERRSTHRRVG